MSEKGIFVGDETEMAAQARQARMIMDLSGGPVDRLRAMFCALLGIKQRVIRAPAKDTEAFARALLEVHGYDPDTHTLAVKRTCVGRGMVVRGPDGRACRYLSTKEIAIDMGAIAQRMAGG